MNFLRTVLRCCAGFQTYREVRDLTVPASLLYLLKLTTLLGLVLAARWVPQGWRLTDAVSDWCRQHVPAFRLQQGKVVANVPQPYRAGDEQFLFILDTTGSVTTPDPQAERGLLVGADSLLFWSRSGKAANTPLLVQRHSLRTFPDTEITADYIRHFLRGAVLMSVPVLYLAGVVVVLGQVLLFSSAAALLERGVATGLRWRQLFNIALHAVTPAAIIVTVYATVGLEGLDLQLIYVIAYGIFLLGATHACRDVATDRTTADNEWL